MLDLLTLTDLYELHADLFTDGTVVHESILDDEGKPVVPVFSDDWMRATRIHDAILDMMEVVSAEIALRNVRQYGARSAGA